MCIHFSTIGVVAFFGSSTNSTDNGQEDVDLTSTYYQQAPTMFFVIVGLASMLFLIVIAIALLCYSHYINHSQRQIEMRSQNTSSMNLYNSENGFSSSISQWSSPETPHQTTPVLFVCNPGQNKPTCFAQVAPLVLDHIAPSENMNYINGNFLYFQTSGLLTPTSMPSSPSPLQPQASFEHELGDRNSTRHSSTLQSLEINGNILSYIPLSLSSNNDTLSNMLVDHNDMNIHDVHKDNNKEVASKNFQARPISLQNMDEKSHRSSTNIVTNFPTPTTINSRFRKEKIDDANEKLQILKENSLPSTSYANLSQKELQQIEEPQPNFTIKPSNVLEPISVIIYKETTMPTNLTSMEQMNSIVQSSLPNKPYVLSTPSTSSSPQIPQMSISKSGGQVELFHENNSMLPLEPSVNVITHSTQ